ncbi:hypothetical protein EVAR_43110_1 [Eumeta japonica]|uniref:Uncharacterized protein n=1 Tax=Eumeta variegata TaxID=151549 RepID=A0A4C1YKE2_EUMVA|nr:hypothetical protein EVAR_43110_1 [Eumeta japonica]
MDSRQTNDCCRSGSGTVPGDSKQMLGAGTLSLILEDSGHKDDPEAQKGRLHSSQVLSTHRFALCPGKNGGKNAGDAPKLAFELVLFRMQKCRHPRMQMRIRIIRSSHPRMRMRCGCGCEFWDIKRIII